MAYRNGTYVAFHANGTNRPGKSDMDYYNMMRAWSARPDDDFTLINSHEKTWAVRDSSSRETLRRSLLERLRNSKNMVLIVGETTRFDNDWVPYEIEKAVDRYGLPIIATYTSAVWNRRILAPQYLSNYWPKALADRISNQTARVMHIPFKRLPLLDAIGQYTHNSLPPHGLWFYSEATYDAWGID